MSFVRRKKALITGASRGIGKACAYLLAEQGYDLYLTCLSHVGMLEEIGKDIIEKYGEHNIECRTFACDGGDVLQVEKLFGEIECPDVVINNAGQAYVGLLGEMTAEAWQHIMDSNLNSVFYVCREAVPGMVRRQSGKIINISSVWGRTGASMEVAYSAAKAGVNGLTRALAKELAPSNIQVNALAPGLVDTDMNRDLTEEDWDGICAAIPMGRAGTPWEAAHMVLQIMNSPAYLTGQIITMDGGWM